MRTVNLFCKVHALANPGAGAWAVTLEDVLSRTRTTLTGGFAHTNLMRLEMTAFLECISALKIPCIVKGHSFNVTIVNVLNGTWKCHSNLDIWKRVVDVLPRHRCEFILVRKSESLSGMFSEAHRIAGVTAHRPDLPEDTGFAAGATEIKKSRNDNGRKSLFSDSSGLQVRHPVYSNTYGSRNNAVRQHQI